MPNAKEPIGSDGTSRATMPSVDFEAAPHLLPFVGTADEHASDSGFAGQVDGRTREDPDGNAEHAQQRARRADAKDARAVPSGIFDAVESPAAEALATGLELLRSAAREASQDGDARVEALSERALNRLRAVSAPETPSRVDENTLEAAASQAGEEILSLIERVSHRIVRITDDDKLPRS